MGSALQTPAALLACVTLLCLGWAVSLISGFGIVLVGCALVLAAASAVGWLDRWLQRDRLA